MEAAAEKAAELLQASQCPVFTLDTDVHGTRAAIALAERAGAAYDHHVDGAALARETALFTDRGAMTIAFGEARRRADVVVLVGELPEAFRPLLAELAATCPDLPADRARTFFLIGNDGAILPALERKVRARQLSCGGSGLNATLAAMRAALKRRQVSTPVTNLDAFADAIRAASFPTFVFSGHGMDNLGMEMLQGLLDDMNTHTRASALHVPASENGWGSVLASVWSTGFAPRTGFARGFPEYDPWRYDGERMITSGEADFQLWVSTTAGRPPSLSDAAPLVALTTMAAPIEGAAVTITIGEAGIDHDGVTYSARTGTLRHVGASAASSLPSAATVLRAIAGRLRAEADMPC